MATLTLQQALHDALAAFEGGNPAEAERLCRRVLAARADHFEALYLLGIVAGLGARAEEAAALLAHAARANPAHADVHYNLGVALGELGRHDEALASYDRALALDARRADVHYNRGVSLGALGRHAEALAAYDAALALEPGNAHAHHNRGIALGWLERPEEAVASYDRAIAIDPRYAQAFNNRGIALALLERFDDSLASCDRAIAIKGDLADAWYNRGNALRGLSRHAEAAASFERAIAIDPAHAAAHWNLADVRLLLGDFAGGWREYEWRWKLKARRQARRDFAQPLWLGAEPLAGRTILLHAELGLGDTLQFCRYARDVAALGARVVLEVQPPLAALLATLEGASAVVARGAPLPDFDCHCPIMSLPLAFRASLATIPAPIPYLCADAALVAAWRERLGARTRPRVGVAWGGSSGLTNDKRSMALARMLPLLRPGIEWVSLQKEVGDAEAALLASHAELRDVGTHLTDFAETAALVEHLDAVVTVDTSVAHLAGAMGKPVWILLAFSQHDWRWHLDREDSPWYPTARLVRQPAAGDWDAVVARVGTALAAQLAC